jgi:CHAD domain-containing protein
MKRKKELRYLKKEWSHLRDHLKDFEKKGGQEDLHRFRVQVKKVRALLALADSENKNGILEKRLKPVRKIFKTAGKIRNAYLNLELAKAYPQAAQLTNGQRRIIKDASARFSSRSASHGKQLKRTRNRLKQNIAKLNDIHIAAYYEQQLKQIADALAHPKSDTDLHACRKQLKILIYNYQLVHPVLGNSANEKYLDQVQTAIGDWHDKQVTIELFASEKGMHTGIIIALKKERTQLKRQLTRLTKDFYIRATTVVELPLEQID